MGKTYVILTREQMAFIRDEVESGRYKNMSDVLKAGLKRLQEEKKGAVKPAAPV